MSPPGRPKGESLSAQREGSPVSRRLVVERRSDAGSLAAWIAPAIALLLTVVTCMLLFALLGRAPQQVVEVFFIAPLATLRGWGEVGLKAAPLILCGVGLALCFRANVWNIGAEGQLIAGAIAGGGVALLTSAASGGGWFVLVLLAGAAGGMAWAALAAWLRDRFNANEILVSLMLVYVAEQLLNYLVYGPWKTPVSDFGRPSRDCASSPPI